MSNIEYVRAELGGWYINGSFSSGPGVLGHYGGGGGGLHANCGMQIGRWMVLDTDFRLAASKYGNKDVSPDFGVDIGLGFGGARWRGRVPGSFVFGVGGGAGIGRPIWLGLAASVYPSGFARFMLKPSRNTRIQLEYRMSPISTQYKFYGAWTQFHDLSISAGYQFWHGGIRARLEDVYLLRDPNRDHRSFWIGPFLAFVYL